MRTFKVYFLDGKQMLLEAPHILAIIQRIAYNYDIDSYKITDICKIEETVRRDDI